MARKNIKMGPMIQFRNKDAPNTLVSLNTSPIFSYFTFAKGGYIIRIKPIARGMLVVPAENELMKADEEGIKYPMATPMIIARKIHQVKLRSRKPSFFLSAAGAQFVADIYFDKIKKGAA
jgi:hypothetical protein